MPKWCSACDKMDGHLAERCPKRPLSHRIIISEPAWMSAPCKSCGKSAREGNHATELGEGHDYEPEGT